VNLQIVLNETVTEFVNKLVTTLSANALPNQSNANSHANPDPTAQGTGNSTNQNARPDAKPVIWEHAGNTYFPYSFIPPKPTLSKILSEMKNAILPYSSRKDPRHWADNFARHVIANGLEWEDAVENLQYFFEKSPDDTVKRWFSSYQHTLTGQVTQGIPFPEIWTRFRSELEIYFNLEEAASMAREEMASLAYWGQYPAEEYIMKVSELTRKSNIHATTKEIMENLYAKLDGDVKKLMGASRHANIIDFQRSLKIVTATNKKGSNSNFQPPLSSVGSSVSQSPQVKQFSRQKLCYFCQLGPHRATACHKLKNATTRLISIDNSLTPDQIFSTLVNKVHHPSPAFQQFYANPQQFFARPEQTRDANFGGQRSFEVRRGFVPRGRGRTYYRRGYNANYARQPWQSYYNQQQQPPSQQPGYTPPSSQPNDATTSTPASNPK